ncbi:MAG: hypothetical protein IPI78_19260 [Chitinophagaceae bacterium]|nr:hypothetical protein [Chitinophagaceae bacterium]
MLIKVTRWFSNSALLFITDAGFSIIALTYTIKGLVWSNSSPLSTSNSMDER